MALVGYDEEKEWFVNIITIENREYLVAAGLPDGATALEVSSAVRRAYIRGLRDARHAIARKIGELDF